MPRLNLAELEVFFAVAEARSFRKAATDRGVSASAMSQAMRSLEERLGVRLLNRTTRSVAPTEAGAQLLQRLGPALAEVAEAVDGVNSFRSKPRGTVRINAPAPAIDFILAPLAQMFLDAYPDVALEFITDAAKVDIVSDGYDAGVRFGEQLAHDMIAVPLGGTLRYLIVGQPAYIAQHGAPQQPEDLLHHACIRQRFPGGEIFLWRFSNGEREVVIVPNGRLTLTNAPPIVQAACDGVGLARVLEEYAEPHLAAGRLVPVLEDWCPRIPGWFLYYPSRRQLPLALRAFLDFVAQWRRKAAGRHPPDAGGARNP